ncbi:MAG: SMP-30/gluconolactonase/LRE family protein [Bacteroidota bacterium]
MRRAGAAILGIGMLMAACNPKKDVHQIGEFIPENDRFWQVVPREAVLERIGIAFDFTEGPAWHADGFLIFSDIPGNTIYRWTEKKFVVFRSPSNHANGLLAEPDGSVLACEHESRSLTRYSPQGEASVLADNYKGRRLNSPNDLCKSSTGSIYFTDPPWGLEQRNEDPLKELPYNGVYHYRNGRLSLIDSTLSWPNGVALSPDERYLYVANMEILRVNGEDQYQVHWMRYTLDEQGEVLEKSIFFTALDTSLPGGPDGMKVDQQGNLFLSGPGGILVVDSVGMHLGTIGIPIPATNLAFGPREKELFITARSTVYKLQL